MFTFPEPGVSICEDDTRLCSSLSSATAGRQKPFLPVLPPMMSER